MQNTNAISILHQARAGVLVRPDYPAKIFTDRRGSYVLLMQALAADHYW